MSSKIRLADVVKGGGAEFIFLGSGAPVIISGGRRLSLDMRVDGKVASIFLVLIDTTDEVEICHGGVSEISETYQSLIAELKAKNYPSFINRHCKFLLGTAVGIAVATAVAIAVIASPLITGKKSSDETSNEELVQLMQAIQPNNSVRRDLPNFPLVGQNAQPSHPVMPPILDRPDFLKKPDFAEPATVTHNTTSKDVENSVSVDEAKNTEIENEPAFGLPAFDPDAFKAESEKVKSVTTKTENTTTDTNIPRKPEAEPKEGEPSPAEGTKPEVEAQNTSKTVNEPTKAAATETKVDSKVDTNPQPPTSDKSASATTEPEFKPINPAEARQQANAVVDRLIQGGMTNGQAGDVLKALENLASIDYAEITPEMISKLPHDVAYLLRENGIIGDVMEPAYTDGVPHRIIRLPDNVIDKYRGPDGVPTIPDANSWAATGNVVRIPPPGGGDLKSPEDFARFGIQTP